MIQKKQSTDHVFGPYSAAARLSSTMFIPAPDISPTVLRNGAPIRLPYRRISAASAYVGESLLSSTSHKKWKIVGIVLI